MKKITKIALFTVCLFLIAILSFLTYALITTSKLKLDKNKLVNVKNSIVFYDKNEKIISEESKNNEITLISDIPDHVKNAFIAIEDKRFYSHKGIDYKGLLRATFNNIKSFSFKEGGSTISQQLIKNSHLTNEKTLKRKISEFKLAKKLEKKYTKDEILEMYLNTIYFGDNCFGITKASKNYFGKSPKELSVNEGAILAGIIKSPYNYSPILNKDKCFERKNVVLLTMKEQNYISKEDYEKLKSEEVKTIEKENNYYDYLDLVKKEVDKYIDDENVYKLNVYTYFDEDLQNILYNNTVFKDGIDKSEIIQNKQSKIYAYLSSVNDIQRQLGSTIKPLLVYAPAIEQNVIDECTLILDEKTDFSGYNPSNYKDKYYGYISAKESLSKSLNIPAIKILNSTGIENAKKYLINTGINLTNNDNSLCLALGATEYGTKLSELVSSYNVFPSGGLYNSPTCIKKITNEKGKIIYKDNNNEKQIFSEETAYILNDMLNETVKNGTAKKLSFLDFDVCAKTGTVGNENGNTDAYTISYNNDYTIGIWYGKKDGSYMSNEITGGNMPAEQSYNIWSKVYKNTTPTKMFTTDKVKYVNIDKLSYDDEYKIEIACENAPERYVKKEIFKINHIPNKYSERFMRPNIENIKTVVNNNGFLIELCQAEYYETKIFKENNGEKFLIYDTDGKDKRYLDTEILPDKNYKYYALPYYKNNGKTICGEEIFIKEIKTPALNTGDISNDKWWELND